MVCVRIFLLAWVGVQRKKIRFSLERICVVLKSERLFIISEINLTFPCFPQLVAGNIWFWSIWMPDFNVKENTVLISTTEYQLEFLSPAIIPAKDEKFCSLTLYVFCFVILAIIYVLLAGSLVYYIWSFLKVL